MKWILTALMVLAMALPAGAQQLNGGFGGIRTSLNVDGADEDISQAFAEIEYQMPLDQNDIWWIGVVTGFDGATENQSLGLRVYFDALRGNGAFPGVGVGAFSLNEDSSDLLSEHTYCVGPELLFEFGVPVGEESIPALLMVGWYPSIVGESDASIVRFGLRLNTTILE